MKAKKPVLVPIPMQLALAIARYYINRDRQYQEVSMPLTALTAKVLGRFRFLTTNPDYKWDKSADVQHVFEVGHKFGFGGGSCMSGTFCFARKGYVYTVNEQSWPKAEREVLKKD